MILAYLRAMRAHQWLKNLLIFVPGLAGHVMVLSAYRSPLMAFVSFCLCASSAYVLNDLIDLHNDRHHATKHSRPFAAGVIPFHHGLWMLLGLLGLALAVGHLVSMKFLGILMGYYLLTVLYSLWIKKTLILDVIVLGCLYVIRILAGVIVFQQALSEWLLGFSVFLFLSLALIKRAAELSRSVRSEQGDPVGRAYRLNDLPLLEMLACASGFTSVLILALYINSPAVRPLYTTPGLLWLCCLPLVYWLCRILLLTHRGEMLDDPVIFVATDRISLGCVLIIGVIAVLASL